MGGFTMYSNNDQVVGILHHRGGHPEGEGQTADNNFVLMDNHDSRISFYALMKLVVVKSSTEAMHVFGWFKQIRFEHPNEVTMCTRYRRLRTHIWLPIGWGNHQIIGLAHFVRDFQDPQEWLHNK